LNSLSREDLSKVFVISQPSPADVLALWQCPCAGGISSSEEEEAKLSWQGTALFPCAIYSTTQARRWISTAERHFPEQVGTGISNLESSKL